MDKITILRPRKNEKIVSYEKLLKMIRKRRITLGSFAKQVGLSREDLYNLRIGTFMSMNAEARCCIFFECDLPQIREIFLPEDWEERMRAECLRKGVDPDARPDDDSFLYEDFL